MKIERKYIVSGDNNAILTKTGNDEWMGTICENELDKSLEEHKWKIKILNTKNKYIMVGVAPSNFDILSTCQYNSCGWYIYCCSSTFYSGSPFKYNGISSNLSRVNDEIIVIMNIMKGSLKFIINNEDKGDSYTNIPIDKSIFLVICFYKPNDSVEITEC